MMVASGQDCAKRNERAQLQRERILCAAQKCFIEHGFHAASMASIAEAAQMSAGLIYRYFENKNAIILAIIARQLEEKQADIAALQTESDLAPRIRELFQSWQGGDSEVMSAPLFLEMTAEASRDRQIGTALRDADERTRAEFSRWLSQRKSSAGKAIVEEEVQWRAFALQCFIEGLAIRAIREPELDKKVLDESLKMLLPVILMG
ncbi:MAG: TetR/AcrR family transcriptional regulator [Gammaproteobacteria bacterium]|nr:TetR/AcrR family transcriptional regulator [Gammaproteobacteria bacterium]MCW8957818.1 TetR/AcrR family transcriptional regulator [Gammaproteobacteria bacterium]MCW8972803.1 TetR/AcrR family transcriptional regulator [Gammaproteobacteria bacterium]MCW8992124.1 TetR/AcrR family transcriptional regulator [Gammaproteobacteria bacterium]